MRVRNITVLTCALVAGVLGSRVNAVTIETVPVGNAGNAGEWSGQSYGGNGPDRICGAVNDEYRIGKYEVTAGQYTEFLNAVAATDTYGLYNTEMSMYAKGPGIWREGSPGSYVYNVSAYKANLPVSYVSWGDAARFANWLHNGQPRGAQDLTTTEDGAYYLNGATTDRQLVNIFRRSNWNWAIANENEWYKAAYHKNDGVTGNYFDYPTSSDELPGHDLADASGNNANYYAPPYVWPIAPGFYTTWVGEFQNSASPYGTFDQGGNVAEWTESLIYRELHGLRGGSRYTTDGELNALRASYRYYTRTTVEHDSIGFRVVQVPEPTSMALLVMGGTGMVFRRTGRQGHPLSPVRDWATRPPLTRRR